jgi:hypothetical protein
MLTQNPTYRLFHALWEPVQARMLLLALFFGKVDREASRVEVDALLQMTYSQLTSVLETLLGREVAGELTEMCSRVSWKHITEYLCTCYYADRAGNAFPGPPGEEAFCDGGSLNLHPQRTRAIMYTVPVPLLPLEQRLLSYGGTRLVYVGEPHVDELLTRGRNMPGPAKAIPGGQPSRCYTNTADLWESHRGELRIVEGYGLSEDGWWRRHSWLLRERPRPRQRSLIETTVKRSRYYGFALNEYEAEAFLHDYGSGFPIYEGLDL